MCENQRKSFLECTNQFVPAIRHTILGTNGVEEKRVLREIRE